MKGIVLGLVMTAPFVLGFFVADRVGRFMDDDHAIFEVPVPREWAGRSIAQIDIRKRYGINIMAVKEDGKMNLSVTPETVLTRNKTLLVLGEKKSIRKCFHI